MTDIPKVQLESWLQHVVQGFYDESSKDETNAIVIEENCHLLHCLTNFIVKTNIPEEVSLTILNCLLPMATELLVKDQVKQCQVFQDLMMVLTTLANAGSGIGHVQLFRACADWMRKEYGGFLTANHEDAFVENACKILEYVSLFLFQRQTMFLCSS